MTNLLHEAKLRQPETILVDPEFAVRLILHVHRHCRPIRFQDLVDNKKVPRELLDRLPPAKNYEKAVFPTLEQQGKGKEIITKQWDKVVGANVQ